MLFQSSLGIDIADSSVAIVYLKASFKGIKLDAHTVFQLEKNITLKEKIEIVGNLTNNFIKENRIATSNIFIGVPRELAILKDIELPLAAKENLRETLRYEMEKYIPLPVDDIYFEYQILEENKEYNRLRILLIVTKKDTITPFFKMQEHLTGGISGIEIRSTAVANYFAFDSHQISENENVMIYTDPDVLELGLLKRKFLNYSRSVKIAEDSQNISNQIEKELDNLKNFFGESFEDYPFVFLGSAIDDEVVHSLRTKTGLNIYSFDISKTPVPSCDLIAAYGIALKGLRKMPMQINFLPAKLRRKPSKFGYYMMIILSGLVLLSGLSWAGSHFVRQRIILNELNHEIQRFETAAADIDRIQKSSKKLEDQIDYLNTLYTGQASSLKVLAELSQRIPKTAWVQNFNYSDKGIQLYGLAESASELITILEASPLFRDVVFLAAITKGKDGKERFRIGLKIN